MKYRSNIVLQQITVRRPNSIQHSIKECSNWRQSCISPVHRKNIVLERSRRCSSCYHEISAPFRSSLGQFVHSHTPRTPHCVWVGLCVVCFPTLPFLSASLLSSPSLVPVDKYCERTLSCATLFSLVILPSCPQFLPFSPDFTLNSLYISSEWSWKWPQAQCSRCSGIPSARWISFWSHSAHCSPMVSIATTSTSRATRKAPSRCRSLAISAWWVQIPGFCLNRGQIPLSQVKDPKKIHDAFQKVGQQQPGIYTMFMPFPFVQITDFDIIKEAYIENGELLNNLFVLFQTKFLNEPLQETILPADLRIRSSRPSRLRPTPVSVWYLLK